MNCQSPFAFTREVAFGLNCDSIIASWSALSAMASGASVTIDDGGEVYRAVTDGLNAEGHLRVLRNGKVLELSAGDVTLGVRSAG